MRNIILLCMMFGILISSKQVYSQEVASYDKHVREVAEQLLIQWMDNFLTYQCVCSDKFLNGGVLCPTCACIHGRIGDAVFPLMYLADQTSDAKYLLAAKRLMLWMENVHRDDSSWMNDVNVSDWNGTTVFASIALYETLLHHGHLLDNSTYNHWKMRLEESEDFIAQGICMQVDACKKTLCLVLPFIPLPAESLLLKENNLIIKRLNGCNLTVCCESKKNVAYIE